MFYLFLFRSFSFFLLFLSSSSFSFSLAIFPFSLPLFSIFLMLFIVILFLVFTYHWDPLDFTANSPNIFLWSELWNPHGTFHIIAPRTFSVQSKWIVKSKLWKVNCEYWTGFADCCMKTAYSGYKKIWTTNFDERPIFESYWTKVKVRFWTNLGSQKKKNILVQNLIFILLTFRAKKPFAPPRVLLKKQHLKQHWSRT